MKKPMEIVLPQTPPILFIFAMLSSMAIVISLPRWIWMNRNGEATSCGSLNMCIIIGQMYVLLGLAIFSLGYTIYLLIFLSDTTEGVTLVPETFILLGSGYLMARHYKRRGVPISKGIFRELLNIFFWVLACVIGWLMTVAAGYIIYHCVVFLSRNQSDYMVFTFIITGALWNIPSLFTHNYVSRNYIKATVVRGVKIQSLLVPIMLAYLILMIPLSMQEAANSPEFLKQKYEKIISKI